MFRLALSDLSSVETPSNEKVQEVLLLGFDGNRDDIKLCVRQGQILLGYNFDKQNRKWSLVWKKTVFTKKAEYTLTKYPWTVTDKLKPGNDIVVLYHPEGIRFYKIDWENAALELLKEDGNFHEIGKYKVWIGGIFPHSEWVGVMARGKTGDTQFYAATADSFQLSESDPLFPVTTDIQFTASWNSASDFFLSDITEKKPAAIGIRTKNAIEFYRFNSEYLLEPMTTIPNTPECPIGHRDALFYARRHRQEYKDILHLNDTGMHVYRYSSPVKEYEFLQLIPEFSETRGWVPNFSKTIILGDLDNDGNDDIIFTSANGLTALSYDSTSYQTILHPESLKSHRYSTAIFRLPAVKTHSPYSSLLVQDLDGQIRYCELTEQITTFAPALPTPPTTSAMLPSGRDQPIALEQVTRITFVDKPVLKWDNQFQSSILKRSVDARTGAARVELPLADIHAATGWKLGLTLYYNSQSTSSGLVGSGWTLPLAELQDYILVDHQGSVYPTDKRYYLMAQGRRFRLTYVKTSEGSKEYKIGDEKSENNYIKIVYNEGQQRWSVSGEQEEVVYGEEAVQRSLEWPHWAGRGVDIRGLRRTVNVWFIKSRFDKYRSKMLRYKYRTINTNLDGDHSYTSDVYLETITDDRDFKMSFKYARKSNVEIADQSQLTDKNLLSFPVALSQTEFLQNINIETPTYVQSFTLLYSIDEQHRLLTGVKQHSNENNPLMEFDYKNVLERKVISKCRVLSFSISYEYDVISMTGNERPRNIYRYSIEDTPKMAYGQDYIAMAYKSHRKISLNILNQSMTRIVADCTEKLKCPILNSDITDFALQAHENLLILFVESDRTIFYIYERNTEIWTKDPVMLEFNKNDLVRFGSKVIAHSPKNSKKLELFLFDPEKHAWKKNEFTLARKIEKLVVSKQLVVVFDGNAIVAYHPNSELQWNSKAVDNNLGHVSSNNQQVLSRFNLSADHHNKILEIMNQLTLQVHNNLITFGSLDLNNAVLSYINRMYLLDSDNNVAKSFNHRINQENIYQMHIVIDHEGNKFKFAYAEESGKLVVRVASVTGEIERKVQQIRNRNIRQDKKEEVLRDANKSTEEMRKHASLVKWNRYMPQIGQDGVYINGETLLRITGDNWKQESVPNSSSIGKHFKLEKAGESSLDLRKRHSNKIEASILLQSPELFVNNYPTYFAYQENNTDTVQVLLLKDGKSINKFVPLYRENILLSSNPDNLITTSEDNKELLIRPLHSLATIEYPYVNQTTAYDENDVRVYTFEHRFHGNIRNLSYSETSATIPGGDKKQFGWHEITITHHHNDTTSTEERWYNGEEEQLPKKGEKNKTNDTLISHPRLLLDKYGSWVISDFSPYSLDDEMVGYFGFESYESQEIGVSYKNRKDAKKRWHFENAEIIEKRFAYTGENYLQLRKHGFFEGQFTPANQESTRFVASSWIRCETNVELDTAVPYLRAVVQTSAGNKIISLMGKVRKTNQRWLYVEVIIDFELVRKVYQDYLTYYNKVGVPDEKLQITLRVESTDGQISVDHVRFSPLTYDFEAEVFDPISGGSVATIKKDGAVERRVYNHLHQQIASVDADGGVQIFGTNIKSVKRNNALNTLSLEFKPTSGIYENFDPQFLHTKWILSNSKDWRVARRQLVHKSPDLGKFQAKYGIFDDKNSAFRSQYALLEDQSYILLQWGKFGEVKLLRHSRTSSTIKIMDKKTLAIPSSGEIIVMIDDNFMWIWLNSDLVMDGKVTQELAAFWPLFNIQARGEVLIEDLFVLNNPEVTVQYYNAFGEKSQSIKLESSQAILVQHILYDQIGRESILSKTTRIRRTSSEVPLLLFRPAFIANSNRSDPKSVWNDGRLLGEVADLNPSDQGYAYSRNVYDTNVLDEKVSVGLPGRDFSVNGKYATKITKNPDVSFVHNIFPINNGYHYKVKRTPSGSKKISVLDKSENEIARYIRVPGYDHSLSVYEYNKSNRLTRIVPPEFHERVNTYGRPVPWDKQKANFSDEEKRLFETLCSSFSYDENGLLTLKYTPDTGHIKYIHNQLGRLRFMVSLNSAGQPKTVVYYEYAESGELARSGLINTPVSIQDLEMYAGTESAPATEDYQVFTYSADHVNPQLRNRIKYGTTYNEDETVIEKLEFDDRENIISREIEAADIPSNAETLTSFKREYINNQLRRLVYPTTLNDKPFQLLHSYNRLGQLISLGTAEDPSRFASFSYHATGHLESEYFQPREQFGFYRKYNYNSPGFLEEITDPYITETIDYANNGYGQNGYGDGMIMQTSYNATWTPNSDGRWFEVRKEDFGENHTGICFDALKRLGYLDGSNRPVKLFVGDVETSMPMVCDGNIQVRIAKLLADRQPPNYYGHRYAYGNHQELVKAKYFSEDTVPYIDPLQPDSFSKNIAGLNVDQSRHIWDLLTKDGYVISEQKQIHLDTMIGKKGKSILNDKNLIQDLQSLSGDYIVYLQPIKKLILRNFLTRKNLEKEHFEKIFLHWQNINNTTSLVTANWKTTLAKTLSKMLCDKGYLSARTELLDDGFLNALHQYKPFILEIVRVLVRHFSFALGSMAYDAESYNIDANGNHRLFYAGFHRYQLFYRDLTNQIETVRLHDWIAGAKQDFPMRHDSHGNVVKAPHKNIQRIVYHRVSERPTRIDLEDGRVVRLYYDLRGERLLKRVTDVQGKLTYEKFYLRDPKGKVLVDHVVKHDAGPEPQTITTTYIYGPRGLCGFVRNAEFHAVSTDHAGSVKLVLKGGRVVAAYDYLPYGELMRAHGNDPHAHIDYRYTGQEWDEETGLYNFHARLYDPSIGRFYQPDPKAQYFSPYKFSGNSPISVIDPDGEFAFLILAIVFAVAGAYLGGAAANNRWNPVDWDFSDLGTWVGMIGGGLAGAFLPFGFAGSAALFAGLTGSSVLGIGITAALGVGGMYLMGTAVNGSFDPTKWQWDRPATWNGLFQGFAIGSGTVGGFRGMHMFAARFSTVGKTVFLTVAYGTGGTLAYVSGALANDMNFKFWQWDPTVSLIAVVDGFGAGAGIAHGIVEVGGGLRKLFRNVRSLTKGQIEINKTLLKKILKNPEHPLYQMAGAALMSFYMGTAASNSLDLAHWNLQSYSTYEGILNGVFMGKNFGSMFRMARFSAIKLKIKEFTLKMKRPFKWRLQNKRLVRSIDDVLLVKNAKLKQLEDIHQDLPSSEPSQSKRQYKLQKNIKTDLLLEWKYKAEELTRRENEIFPDKRDGFLKCKTIVRKKRSPNAFSCFIPPSDTDNNNEGRTELVQNLFDVDDAGLKNIGNDAQLVIPGENGFAENLSRVFEGTPVKSSVLKDDFFHHVILGSALTLPESSLPARAFYMKVETTKKQQVLTIIYAEEKSGKLIKKSFASKVRSDKKTQKSKLEQDINKENAEALHKASKLTDEEIKIIQKDMKITEIVEHSFYLTGKNELFVKVENTKGKYEARKARATTDFKKYNLKTVFDEFMGDSTNPEYDELRRIQSIVKNHELEKNLHLFSNDNIDDVAAGAKGFFEDISDIYNHYKSEFTISSNLEAQFHAFLYGALELNYKGRFDVDTFIERNQGQGYADVLILPSKGKNWKSIPVVVELKIDGVSSNAVDQIIKKGYLYNMGLKTLAEKAVIVGVNPRNPLAKRVEVKILDIPQPEFVNILLQDNVGDSVLAKQLQKELLHLHYSISPESIHMGKYMDHTFQGEGYLNRLILGHVLSKSDSKVFVRSDDKLQTFVFKFGRDTGKWTMLNMHLGNDFTQPVSRPKGVMISRQIDINVNPKSRIEISTIPYEYTPIEVSSNIDQLKVKESGNFHLLQNDIDIDNFFEKNMQSSEEHVKSIANEFEKLEKQLRQLGQDSFIASESDFQAIVQGLFLGNRKTVNADGSITLIRVFPEANFSNSGFADLIIQKIRYTANNVVEKGVIVVELKRGKSSLESGTKMKDAKEQVKKYVGYSLRTITDLDHVSTVAACYDVQTRKILTSVEHMEIPKRTDAPDLNTNRVVPNTKKRVDSDMPGCSSSHCDDSSKKRKIDKRSISSIDKTSPYNWPNTSVPVDSHITQSISFESSSASRMEFWPLKLVGQLQDAFTSLKSVFWGTPVSSNVVNFPYHEPNYASSFREPRGSILGAGDDLIANCDLNGLMLLSHYLIKMENCKTKNIDAKSNLPQGLDESLLASEIVDEFFRIIDLNVDKFDFRDMLSKHWDNAETYYEALDVTKKIICKDNISKVPHELGELFYNKINHVSHPNRNNLLDAVSSDFPMFLEKIETIINSNIVDKHTTLQNGYSPYNEFYENQNMSKSSDNNLCLIASSEHYLLS